MSIDQAALQIFAACLRAHAEVEEANRARRRRAAELFDIASWSASAPRVRGTRSGNMGPAGEGPREVATAMFRTAQVSPLDASPVRDALEDAPRGKGAPRIGGPATSRPLVPGAGASASSATKLAAGYQPAVLKVISYGHGGARATAIGQYIQRDEAALETHEGKIVCTHEAVAAEMKEWARSFDKRKESDDVATFSLSVKGEGEEQLAAAVEVAFSGHRYAYRIDTSGDGSCSARVVATMAGRALVQGENGDEAVKERFHVAARRGADGRLTFSRPTKSIIGDRIAGALGVEADAVSVTLVGEPSHGKAGVVFQLSRLVHDGPARNGDGGLIGSEQQVRQAAQAWHRSLNSFSPRDTMHMILSAKAGADKEALVRAARGFLHEQFADHKFAFALHDDKEADGHMHVHAIVAVKGEDGERLRTGPAVLRCWRHTYAEHAEAEGLKIVATAATYRASSQSYGPRDKAIVDAAERPRAGREARDRAYAQMNPHVVENARERIQRARQNPILIPETGRRLAAVNAALEDWRAVAGTAPDSRIAVQYVERLTMAASSGSVLSRLDTYRKGIAMTKASAAEMRENLKDINDAVQVTAGLLTGATRAEFLRRSAEAMEMLAVRTDLKARQETGATQISEEEARAMIGPRANELIARAREIQAAEDREAQRAEQIRDRAIEREARSDAGTSPSSLQQVADRALVRQTETIAAKERQEAQAAAEAARAIAAHPAERIDPNLVKGERLEDLAHDQADRINTKPLAAEKAETQKPRGQRQ